MLKVEIKINTFKPRQIVTLLAKELNIPTKVIGAEILLELPEKIGKGSIKGIDFLDGMGMMRFDCVFESDVFLEFGKSKLPPIQFVFCAEGTIIHELDGSNLRYKLNGMIGSIVCSSNDHKQYFMIPPHRRIVFYTLFINKEVFFPKIKRYLNTVPSKLADVFRDVECKEIFLYQSDYSLNIAENIQEIEHNEHEGLVQRIFLESKALDLLWMQIKQYKDDQNPISKQKILRRSDIELILNAKKELTRDLKNPPDIKGLADITATNQSKLKRGFRKLYDKSIGEVLRDEKLNYAKMLLAEENRSIKEISNAVGYASQSAFTKQFKNKFGVLPSEFLKRYKEN